MNKKDLIKKISGFTGLTNEEKSYLTELVKTKKKYGLVWEDKPEDVEEQLRSMLPVFKEVKERAIISENPEAPNHILIEGDNLHALTALSYTHEGKIDVIYIDPPYNTGNKDFIYNDHYVDKEDTYRHSKWLSFMEKRLKIAKKLLSQKGIIFISIDDNEQAQLKLLCTEIFDANNFIDNIIWKKTENIKMDSKFLSQNKDFVTCFRKSEEITNFSKELSDLERFKEKDEIGQYYLRKLDSRSSTYSKGMDYIIEYDDTKYYAGGSFIDWENRQVVKPGKKAPTWLWSKKKYEEGLKSGEIIFKNGNVYNKVRYDGIAKKPFINIQSIASGQTAQKELDAILGGRKFDHPKPYQLVEWLMRLYPNNLDIKILDFFAGSGTSLHATMALNNDDGGNRQCILVTNNENNICEEVTYERNKRVIEGYTNAKGIEVEGLENNNLRYFQADFVASERTEINRRLLTARSTDLLCIKEDCFISNTKNWEINEKQAQIFTNGLGKYMVVVYHSRITGSVIEEITKKIETLETTEKVKVYAFNPTKDSIEDDFFKVADKIVAVPLPDSIYNAYLATFRSLKINKDTL